MEPRKELKKELSLNTSLLEKENEATFQLSIIERVTKGILDKVTKRKNRFNIHNS